MKIRNVVFVSYDCARADVTYAAGLRGVERLRARGTTFRNAVSSCPLTPVSHATIFTGVQPYHHGVRHLFKEQIRAGTPTVAALLGQQGFTTSAVVSCAGLNKWYGFDRGFDVYDDEIPRLADGTDPLLTVDVELRGTALKRAPLVVERSRRSIEQRDHAPFFHFMHFFDAHWPYAPPDIPPGAAGKNGYEQELAYVDGHFATWLDWMEESGRIDDTLIVLFGDHGEDLAGWYPNDRGGDQGEFPEEKGHGALLYDTTLMVPLIFSHPSLARREVTDQVALVDVAATCFDLLGMPPLGVTDGVSLARTVLESAAVPEVPAYSETFYPEEIGDSESPYRPRAKKSVRIANRHKVIHHLQSDVVEIYDLEHDPLERSNLLRPRRSDLVAHVPQVL